MLIIIAEAGVELLYNVLALSAGALLSLLQISLTRRTIAARTARGKLALSFVKYALWASIMVLLARLHIVLLCWMMGGAFACLLAFGVYSYLKARKG